MRWRGYGGIYRRSKIERKELSEKGRGVPRPTLALSVLFFFRRRSLDDDSLSFSLSLSAPGLFPVTLVPRAFLSFLFPLFTSLLTFAFLHNDPLARVRSPIAARLAKGHRWRYVPGSIAEIRQSFGNAVENRRSRKHTPVGSGYTQGSAPFFARAEDSSAMLFGLGASSPRSYYTTEAWRGVSSRPPPMTRIGRCRHCV